MRELLQECQRVSTHYEWVVEIIDIYDDIVDCQYFDSIKHLMDWVNDKNPEDYNDYQRFDWGLVRSSGSEADGMQDREYAYVSCGKIPTRMDGGSKVPQKYIKEFEGCIK